MQGLRRFHHLSSGGVRLHLSPAIDVVAESADARIQRLVSENPVIIFSRASCCMCHVMRILLSSIGVHPTVIELDDDDEIATTLTAAGDGGVGALPAVFIGGTRVGGLEGLVALHLSAQLVPMLVELGMIL